jgi:hypothetical protein
MFIFYFYIPHVFLGFSKMVKININKYMICFFLFINYKQL